MRWDIRVTAHFYVSAAFLSVCIMFAPDVLHFGETARDIGFFIGLIGAILFGILGFRAALREEQSTPKLEHRRRMLAIYGMVVFGAGFLGCAAWYFFWPDKEPPQKMSVETTTATPGSSPRRLDNTISFAWSWSKPPTHYREDKTLHIVDFQGVPITGINPEQQTAGPMHFVRSSEPFSPSENYSDMWYRCDVTNHSAQPIRNLWTKFPVVYNAAIPQKNGTRSGEVVAAGFARSPMLDLAAGETDYFYFANASAVFITILPPQLAFLQTMANDAVHEVRVVASSNWQVALMPSSKPIHPYPPKKPPGNST
jgi:hypothetical protein